MMNYSHGDQSHRLIVALCVMALILACSNHSNAFQIQVGGGLAWTIPPNNDFYNKWSSDESFHTGDNLVFEFESEFHTVMQVSRREYENCSAESPFQAFSRGPAIVPLIQEGVYYFICNVADHCALGQKLCVAVVDRRSDAGSSQPSMAPSLPPIDEHVNGDDPSLPLASSSRVHADKSSALHLSGKRCMTATVCRALSLIIICVVLVILV